mgnify:CR=1 FL=1
MTASDAVPAVPEPTELTSLPVYDHWETRAICNDVDGTHIEKYYPKQAPGDSTSTPIQFSIKGNSDHIDLNHSFLLISGQFEGKVPKKTTPMAPSSPSETQAPPTSFSPIFSPTPSSNPSTSILPIEG